MGRKQREKKKEKLSGRAILLRLLLIMVIAGVVTWQLIRLMDMSYFVDTFYFVDDEKIQNPFRIVLLSDLHLQEFGHENEKLVDEIRRLKPDIIAMAGDMINETDPDESVVVTLCRNLVDVAPVYFAYGNHEKQVIRVEQTSTLNVTLEAMGVHVLHNRYETIDVNGNLIDIGGLSANPGTLDASYTQRFWQSYLKSPNYRLLLVHYPQYFFTGGELVGEEIDMALCGHLHGGQAIIPFIGGIYHPLEGFLPEMTDGCHLIANTWVIISRGLGNGKSLPRFNNPPELVIIDVN